MSDSNDKKWFEKLRVNSWEIEILIVACILAALFNLPDISKDNLAALEVSAHNDFRAENGDPENAGSSFWIVLGVIKVFIYSFFGFFISIAKLTFSFYVFFRGFWVAVIGLSSVFSKGINIKKLGFSSYFNKLIPDYSFNRYILRLDNICSSVFSLGFLIAFFCGSFLLYLSIVAFSLGLVEFAALSLFKESDWFFQDYGGVMIYIFIAFGVFFFIDILFLGIFKRVKWKVFSYPYSKMYSLLRLVTGFFIYESIYYLFISNVKRRVLLILFIIFILLIAFGISNNKANGYLNFPSDTLQTKSFMSKNHYEDRLLSSGDNFSSTKYPFINSEIISDNYLKIYIPFHPYIHTSLDSACGITSQIIANDQKIEHEILIDCINNVYAIYIDNDTITNNFVFYDYSFKDVSIQTFFMPISLGEYKDGKHVITIEKLFPEGYVFPDNDSYVVSGTPELRGDTDSILHIPFYIYR